MDDSTGASPRLAAIIANPVKVDVAALRRAVAEAERAHGWPESLWLETSEDDPGFGQAREALERGATLLVPAGGDGTVRAVAEVLGEHLADGGGRAALGAIPAGTGNLLARNLGVEIGSITAAVEVAFGGREREIDYGIAEIERPDGERELTAFTVLCGVGIDAAMIANTDSELKAKVGWLAYVGGILRSVRGGRSLRLRFRIDGGVTQTTHANTIMIGNCGILPGNVVLLPDATIDDGELDIALLRPKGLLGWLQIWIRMLVQSGLLQRTEWGKRMLIDGRPIRALNYSRCEEIVIRLDSGPQEFEVDGDAAGEIVAARVRVRPRGLVVMAPAETPRSAVEAADAAIARLQSVVGQLPGTTALGSLARPGLGMGLGGARAAGAGAPPGRPVAEDVPPAEAGLESVPADAGEEAAAREELDGEGLSGAAKAAEAAGAATEPDPKAHEEPEAGSSGPESGGAGR
ncbi:Putative lipid kinase BmrU [Pseudoclavibacter triregionum]|nr:Putative lipid kinase BmrU [Pseudoclavibacter triregionum]